MSKQLSRNLRCVPTVMATELRYNPAAGLAHQSLNTTTHSESLQTEGNECQRGDKHTLNVNCLTFVICLALLIKQTQLSPGTPSTVTHTCTYTVRESSSQTHTNAPLEHWSLCANTVLPMINLAVSIYTTLFI